MTSLEKFLGNVVTPVSDFTMTDYQDLNDFERVELEEHERRRITSRRKR